MQAGVMQLWSGVCVCYSWKEERLAVAPVRGGEKGFVLPAELIHSESKQIQVSTASLKPQRRVELKIAVYNKLPMDIFLFLALFFLLTLRRFCNFYGINICGANEHTFPK